MEEELNRINKYLKHHKIALYAIIAFLVFITALIVIVAQKISSEQALKLSSQASYENYFGGSQTTISNTSNNDQNGDGVRNSQTTLKDTVEQCCNVDVQFTPVGYYGYQCDFKCNGRTYRFNYTNDAQSAAASCELQAKYKCCRNQWRANNDVPLCSPIQVPDVPTVPPQQPPTATPTIEYRGRGAVADSCETAELNPRYSPNPAISYSGQNSCGFGGVNSATVTCTYTNYPQRSCTIYKNTQYQCFDPSKITAEMAKQACCKCRPNGTFFFDSDYSTP